MGTRIHAAAWAAAFLILSGTSAAQTSYPVKPIRIVIGTPAGGGSEISARMSATLARGTFSPRARAASRGR